MATDTGTELLTALRQAEAELARVNAEIVAAEQVLSTLQTEIAAATAENAQLVQYAADVKANIRQYEADADKLQAENAALTATNTDLQQRSDALHYEISASKAELAALA